MTNTIDLSKLTGAGRVHNLAGRERGEAARREFDLDELDSGQPVVTIVVPDDLYGISSSFFSGMFSKSIETLGNEESFLAKYRFDADSAVMAQIRHALDRCLTTRNQLRSNSQAKREAVSV